MRNQLQNLFFGKNATATILILFAIFALVGLGCRGGRSGDAKPMPPAYLGDWQGQDGSTLSIRADGKGDYRAGNTKIEGGTAEVDETAKTVSITFFSFGKTLKIDEPPAGDQMRLDGVVYRRSGGFSTNDTGLGTTNDTDLTPPTPAQRNNTTRSDDAPSDSETESLIKDTIADFADGVEQEDFTGFHSRTSKDFQATYKPAQLNTTFQIFIQKKDQALPILNTAGGASTSFTNGPRIRTEKGYKILVADGNLSTRPYPVQFETEYVLERGEWKLLKFRVKM
jgi:hypothetical protein